MNDHLQFHGRIAWLAIDCATTNPRVLSGLWFCSDYDSQDTLCIRIGRNRIACACRLKNRLPDGRHFVASVKTRTGAKWLRFCRETPAGRTVVITRRLLLMPARLVPSTRQEVNRANRQQAAFLAAQPVPAHGPLISVLMPVFNPPSHCLEQAIASVRAQTYQRWELCIADDASTDPAALRTLREQAARDPRIKFVERPVNGHISAATNSSLALASGEWCALLDQDDELSPHAFAAFARTLQAHPDTDLVYTDEDKLDAHGQRHSAYHKPDWMPELLFGQNFVSHLGFYRTDRLRSIGGFREGFEGCQDWDVVLRYTHGLPMHRVRHLPYILYHWRALPHSTAHSTGAKPYIIAAAERTVTSALQARSLNVRIHPASAGQFKIEPLVITRPTVAVLGLPTADQTLVTDLTDYDHLTCLPAPPSTANHLEAMLAAAHSCQAEIIVVLAPCVVPLHRDWLQRLVGSLAIPGVVAAGGALINAAGLIADGCLMLDHDNQAVPAFKDLVECNPGYFGRAQLLQNPGGLSLNCLAVRRTALLSINPPKAGRRSDAQSEGWTLCEQLRSVGGRIVYDPGVILDIDPASAPPTPATALRFRSSSDPSIHVNLATLWPTY
ncbi:MAG: glycosyltransferase [Opitutaceae bacterium]|jgi:hypothetical protein